jgi:hypothetical protein
VDDLGQVVAQLLEQPALRHVGVVGDDLPCAAYADVLTRVLGREVRYRHVESADYARLPFPGAADLAAMFDLNRRFIPSRSADLAATRALSPDVLSFDAWATAHADQLRAVCLP